MKHHLYSKVFKYLYKALGFKVVDFSRKILFLDGLAINGFYFPSFVLWKCLQFCSLLLDMVSNAISKT
jgi:hypothetical protein